MRINILNFVMHIIVPKIRDVLDASPEGYMLYNVLK